MSHSSQPALFVYVRRDLNHLVRETAAPVAPETAVTDVPSAEPSYFILPETIDLAAAEFLASLKPDVRAKINGRFERGVAIAKEGKVTFIEARRFRVRSSTPGYKYTTYYVDLDAKTCSCPDSQNGNTCKHRVACFLIEQCLAKTPQPANPEPPEAAQPAPEVMPLPGDQPDNQEAETAQPIFDGLNDPQPNPWQAPAMAHLLDTLSVNRATGSNMICAIAHEEGQSVPVEILTALAGIAFVAALPTVREDGTLTAVMPFVDPFGMGAPWGTAELSLAHLSNITVYNPKVMQFANAMGV